MPATILESVLAKGQDFMAFLDDAASTWDAPFWQTSGFATEDETLERTYEGVLSTSEAVPAAAIIDFSGEFPLMTRPTISTLSGKIPTMAGKLQMDKEEIRKFYEWQDKLSSGKITGLNELKLLDFIYPDLKLATTAPHKRIDHMMLETISTGYTTMDKTNNPNGVTWNALDWGVDKKYVTTVWSDTAAVPITDIHNTVKYWRAKGIEMKYMLMNYTTFYQMLATTQFVNKFGLALTKGAAKTEQAQLPVIGKDVVNAHFVAMGLPEIIIVNQPVDIAARTGIQTSTTPFADSRVTFVPSLDFGKVVWTYTNAQRNPDPAKMFAVSNLTSIYRWAEGDNEFTSYELNAIFVLNIAKQMSVMLTDATSA